MGKKKITPEKLLQVRESYRDERVQVTLQSHSMYGQIGTVKNVEQQKFFNDYWIFVLIDDSETETAFSPMALRIINRKYKQ